MTQEQARRKLHQHFAVTGPGTFATMWSVEPLTDWGRRWLEQPGAGGFPVGNRHFFDHRPARQVLDAILHDLEHGIGSWLGQEAA